LRKGFFLPFESKGGVTGDSMRQKIQGKSERSQTPRLLLITGDAIEGLGTLVVGKSVHQG
jgi:hypothetical protein